LESIAEVVSFDQALTGRALRAANSAASAAHSTITTVKDAVVRLGRSTMLTLGFGPKVRQQLQAGRARIRAGREHAVATFGGRGAGRRIHGLDVQGADPAGILRGRASARRIGKLVLARFLDPELSVLPATRATRRPLPPAEAEMEILEVNHAELGALIARHWGLPSTIALGIQYHHTPTEEHPLVCHVVCVANVLAKSILPDAETPPPYPEDHT
jgi:HD-like signal output (HDOD) protein